jgi:hypothetical protein
MKKRKGAAQTQPYAQRLAQQKIDTITAHREDAAQTVHIKARTTPDTGSGNILLAWITLTTAAGMFLLIMILRTYSERRRTDI